MQTVYKVKITLKAAGLERVTEAVVDFDVGNDPKDGKCRVIMVAIGLAAALATGMTAWLVLFTTQIWLVSSKRIKLHMNLRSQHVIPRRDSAYRPTVILVRPTPLSILDQASV